MKKMEDMEVNLVGTVKLDHDQIIAALKEFVYKRGMTAATVEITSHEAQYKGPTVYSAVLSIEVEPKKTTVYRHKSNEYKDDMPVTWDG